jgi:hypothetical protein
MAVAAYTLHSHRLEAPCKCRPGPLQQLRMVENTAAVANQFASQACKPSLQATAN